MIVLAIQLTSRTEMLPVDLRSARKIDLAIESWTLSRRRESAFLQESHTGPAYSSTGRTRAKYRLQTKLLSLQR